MFSSPYLSCTRLVISFWTLDLSWDNWKIGQGYDSSLNSLYLWHQLIEHECRIGTEIGVDPAIILATSHGRRSIDMLKIYQPEKANWDCKSCLSSTIQMFVPTAYWYFLSLIRCLLHGRSNSSTIRWFSRRDTRSTLTARLSECNLGAMGDCHIRYSTTRDRLVENPATTHTQTSCSSRRRQRRQAGSYMLSNGIG